MTDESGRILSLELRVTKVERELAEEKAARKRDREERKLESTDLLENVKRHVASALAGTTTQLAEVVATVNAALAAVGVTNAAVREVHAMAEEARTYRIQREAREQFEKEMRDKEDRANKVALESAQLDNVRFEPKLKAGTILGGIITAIIALIGTLAVAAWRSHAN